MHDDHVPSRARSLSSLVFFARTGVDITPRFRVALETRRPRPSGLKISLTSSSMDFRLGDTAGVAFPSLV